MDEAIGRIFSVERTWQKVAFLLETPGLAPIQLRGALLDELCRAFGADSAILVPIEQRRVQWNVAISTGKEKAWIDYHEVVDRALRRRQPFLLEENTRECLGILKLKLNGRLLSILLLAGRELFRPDTSDSEFVRLGHLLSLIEQNQRLRSLLELTQEKLERFRSDSEKISQGNERLFQQLSSNQDRLESISKGIIKVQENERSKISRELHDGLGQALTALKINIDLLGAEMENKLSRPGQDRLADTRSLASEAIEEVRELSRLLRPRILDELGLSPTLSWYARTLGKRTGLRIDIEDQCDDSALSWEVETLIFRVTQEALNNIVKHSGSPTAQVRLRSNPDAIQLEISDQGNGFETSSLDRDVPTGSGLPGMRDRVSLLGGRLSLNSRPGHGTTLFIEIPKTGNMRLEGETT